MNFDVFKYLSSLAFIFIYSRLAIHYAPAIFFYFINSNSSTTRYLEKPRILFHLIGLSFMHLMYSFHQTYRGSDISLQLLALLIFSLGLYFCVISWGEKFKSSFSEKLKIKAARPINNFNLSISDFQINRLYNDLVRFDLIDQDETSFEDFTNVFLKNWNSHSSRIHLKMDGPTCREFFDGLVRTFPNNSMTLKNLFINSGLVLRPDAKKYNYNTLKNAPTRTPLSKQHQILKMIFRNIKNENIS